MAGLNDRALALIQRQKHFVLDVVKLCEALPKGMAYEIFSRQVIRSASSIGANYRAACRAKSGKDFINKMKIVEEEADETIHWLELIAELPQANKDGANALAKVADEFVSIAVASIRTARNRNNADGGN